MVLPILARSVAKGVAKGAAKQAKRQAVQLQKNARRYAQNQFNQTKRNMITYGRVKMNQAQSNAARRIGAVQTGYVQGGLPIMQGPRGGNFRLGENGKRYVIV